MLSNPLAPPSSPQATLLLLSRVSTSSASVRPRLSPVTAHRGGTRLTRGRSYLCHPSPPCHCSGDSAVVVWRYRYPLSPTLADLFRRPLKLPCVDRHRLLVPEVARISVADSRSALSKPSGTQDQGYDEPPGTDKLRRLHCPRLPPPPDTAIKRLLASAPWDLSSDLDLGQSFISSSMSLLESLPEVDIVTQPLKPHRCSRELCAAVATVKLGLSSSFSGRVQVSKISGSSHEFPSRVVKPQMLQSLLIPLMKISMAIKKPSDFVTTSVFFTGCLSDQSFTSSWFSPVEIFPDGKFDERCRDRGHCAVIASFHLGRTLLLMGLGPVCVSTANGPFRSNPYFLGYAGKLVIGPASPLLSKSPLMYYFCSFMGLIF